MWCVALSNNLESVVLGNSGDYMDEKNVEYTDKGFWCFIALNWLVTLTKFVNIPFNKGENAHRLAVRFLYFIFIFFER